MSSRIVARGVSKRFTLPRLPRRTTLKDQITSGAYFTFDRSRRIVQALTRVSFDVAPGQMLGVIGRNGSGKTTLLRLLAGIYAPDEGEIVLQGKITPLLALGAGFHPDLTGRENARIELLVLGVERRRLERYVDEIIAFSELSDFIDVPMRMYSAGMATRLGFATATCLDLDVLLVDEALAVGDESFAAKCHARIDEYRARGKTIVFVSHGAETVAKRCDVALWLEEGRMAAYGAPADVVRVYGDYLKAKAVNPSLAALASGS